MSFSRVVILAVIQGLAELLPVSSSAHVVVAEKLMGLDPSAPDMTMLLVSLHTGTMLAVIAYFWTRWRRAFFPDAPTFMHAAAMLVLATILTGVIGEGLVLAIEHVWLRGTPKAEVEDLFGRLDLIAPALAAAGVLILISARGEQHQSPRASSPRITAGVASVIGLVQGLCLPFRGFSRSGATISTALLAGMERARAEDFSFALAVLLTPPVVGREALRVVRAGSLHQVNVGSVMAFSALGGICAFVAGLVALRWLSRWLEIGRWRWFGVYCLAAAVAVGALYYNGF